MLELSHMGRTKSVPTYRKHRQSGQAITTLTDPSGQRKDVLLGRYGTSESRKEYARVLGEWEANGRRIAMPRSDLTVAEVMVQFLEYANTHYRQPDGTLSSEYRLHTMAFKPLKAMYAHTLASEFGPLALRAARDHFIAEKMVRKSINKMVSRIRHMFKWATSLELVPATTYEALRTVPSLTAGRSAAKESEPVKPVPDSDVDAVLPHLRRQTRTIVLAMRYCGARPGEICRMRPCDIDASGGVWLYKPAQHKNAWRGLTRVIALGPKAQEVIKPFLSRDHEAFLFSPREAIQELWAEQRAARKSPLCAHDKTSRMKRLRQLNDHYTVSQLDQAIERACEKAKVDHWSANQLRHSHATKVRQQYGLEGAGAALGHSKMSATEIYAERDIELAKQIASEIG
jgi:integrase